MIILTSGYVYMDGPAGVIVRRDLLPLLRGASGVCGVCAWIKQK